jgi:hypothetical protein
MNQNISAKFCAAADEIDPSPALDRSDGLNADVDESRTIFSASATNTINLEQK